MNISKQFKKFCLTEKRDELIGKILVHANKMSLQHPQTFPEALSNAGYSVCLMVELSKVSKQIKSL